MSLLSRLKNKFRREVGAGPPARQLNPDLVASIEAIKAPAPPVPEKREPRGRVIKETHHAEYNPRARRRGGRIVKAMPRELQRIKQAQDKVEDDGDQPKVEEIPE